MRVLLAGFGRFPGARYNPSADLARFLARRRRPAFADVVRTAHVFATSYACVDRDLSELLASRPDVVVMFGLAARTRHLRIEMRARNAVSVLFPDTAGHRPQQRVIAPGAPAALRGAAPFAGLLETVRRGAIPARLSRDAGRYLCNYAYWRALEHSRRGKPLVQFVHIPPVRLNRRPVRRGAAGSPSFSRLAAQAENLLVALIAAYRR